MLGLQTQRKVQVFFFFFFLKEYSVEKQGDVESMFMQTGEEKRKSHTTLELSKTVGTNP